jgi:hypothetical protein
MAFLSLVKVEPEKFVCHSKWKWLDLGEYFVQKGHKLNSTDLRNLIPYFWSCRCDMCHCSLESDYASQLMRSTCVSIELECHQFYTSTFCCPKSGRDTESMCILHMIGNTLPSIKMKGRFTYQVKLIIDLLLDNWCTNSPTLLDQHIASCSEGRQWL